MNRSVDLVLRRCLNRRDEAEKSLDRYLTSYSIAAVGLKENSTQQEVVPID